MLLEELKVESSVPDGIVSTCIVSTIICDSLQKILASSIPSSLRNFFKPENLNNDNRYAICVTTFKIVLGIIKLGLGEVYSSFSKSVTVC